MVTRVRCARRSTAWQRVFGSTVFVGPSPSLDPDCCDEAKARMGRPFHLRSHDTNRSFARFGTPEIEARMTDPRTTLTPQPKPIEVEVADRGRIKG